MQPYLGGPHLKKTHYVALVASGAHNLVLSRHSACPSSPKASKNVLKNMGMCLNKNLAEAFLNTASCEGLKLTQVCTSDRDGVASLLPGQVPERPLWAYGVLRL